MNHVSMARVGEVFDTLEQNSFENYIVPLRPKGQQNDLHGGNVEWGWSDTQYALER